MTKLTPNIYLSPRQLQNRAAKTSADAAKLRPGKAREALLKAAERDRTMANMKRLIGDTEDETSTGVMK